MDGRCDLNNLLIGNREALVFYVHGSEFEGFGLKYGDLLMVHTEIKAKAGDLVLMSEEEDISIERFYNLKNNVMGVITSVIKFQQMIFTDYHIQQLVHENKPKDAFERHQQGRIDLNQALVKHPEDTYLVEVLGNSMKDSRIYSGDIVIVDKALPITDNVIIAARINGEVTLKRFEHDLRPKLAPANPKFRKIHIPYNEDSVTEGVVVASIQRLRKL